MYIKIGKNIGLNLKTFSATSKTILSSLNNKALWNKQLQSTA